ncbi:MAG: glutathione S-transferase [Acidobacteriota bacterium]|nr:glutathione S-transferase [Acidobacteriota bacterium]
MDNHLLESRMTRNLPSSITLRYFDITGRAQPLRDLLHDAEVAFEDHRVPREQAVNGEWVEQAKDPALGGPYGTLPVLHWGDFQLAQTEAVAWFLGQKLGYAGDDEQSAALSAALCSLGHQDLIIPLGMMLWSPVLKPDADLREAASQTLMWLQRHLVSLERQLETGGQAYLLGAEPTVGDFFAFEGVDAVAELYGGRTLEPFPNLQAWRQRILKRPRLKDPLANRPTFFCSCSSEAETRDRLKEWFH